MQMVQALRQVTADGVILATLLLLVKVLSRTFSLFSKAIIPAIFLKHTAQLVQED